jgi:hypothetical protein
LRNSQRVCCRLDRCNNYLPALIFERQRTRVCSGFVRNSHTLCLSFTKWLHSLCQCAFEFVNVICVNATWCRCCDGRASVISSCDRKVDYTSQQHLGTDNFSPVAGSVVPTNLSYRPAVSCPGYGRPRANLSNKSGHSVPPMTRLRTLSDIVRQWHPASALFRQVPTQS